MPENSPLLAAMVMALAALLATGPAVGVTCGVAGLDPEVGVGVARVEVGVSERGEISPLFALLPFDEPAEFADISSKLTKAVYLGLKAPNALEFKAWEYIQSAAEIPIRTTLAPGGD